MFDREVLIRIRQHLLEHEETIAVAESVTSGFFQAAFSSVPDAANFFQGGITVYNLGQKFKHLQVNPIHAEGCDCVSEKVASEMALHVCPLFGSQWGVGITGYASKVPEGKHQLFAHYAISHHKQVVAAGVIKATIEEGLPTQLYFVNEVLVMFQDQLLSNGKSNTANSKKTEHQQEQYERS